MFMFNGHSNNPITNPTYAIHHQSQMNWYRPLPIPFQLIKLKNLFTANFRKTEKKTFFCCWNGNFVEAIRFIVAHELTVLFALQWNPYLWCECPLFMGRVCAFYPNPSQNQRDVSMKSARDAHESAHTAWHSFIFSCNSSTAGFHFFTEIFSICVVDYNVRIVKRYRK